jgi:hypothetical protein
MQGKRRWLGLAVWIADADGKRRNGVAWWEDESSILIRQHGVVGIQVLPRAAEGIRWGFADEADKPPKWS